MLHSLALEVTLVKVKVESVTFTCIWVTLVKVKVECFTFICIGVTLVKVRVKSGCMEVTLDKV